MKTPYLIFLRRTWLLVGLALGASAESASTGSIEGRVLNRTNGTYLTMRV